MPVTSYPFPSESLHPTVYSEKKVWLAMLDHLSPCLEMQGQCTVSLRKPPAKASRSQNKIQISMLKGKTKDRHGEGIAVLAPTTRETKGIIAVHSEDMPSPSQFPASIHLVRTHPLHTTPALDFLLQFGDSERHLLSPCLSTPLNLLGT